MTGIAALQAGLDAAEALSIFDALEPVDVAQMYGRWHGSEVPTCHPMDGLLDVSGWYGKEFADADHVHPLLFGTPGDLYPVNPKLIPLGSLNKLGDRVPRWLPPGGQAGFRLLRTRRHRARLREISYREKVSAAMVYDGLPIIDHFRRIDDDTLLGAMDQRGADRPYFFLLQRD
ncbi:MAG: DUF4334 domain-containing protein [Gordonia sp. (in: high G+C Gram-positive bacteria)]|uniref:DUF4334 domain-containing protein n=1 Tax=Gordonia sp. (in: high G+C Gram-positive bacteria) TaxID=84139 RepID=UPI003BB63827